MSRYCPDCGDVLVNPNKCTCGWKSGVKELVIDYDAKCQVHGCVMDTDVVIDTRYGKVTRCARHYTDDLLKAGKNQLKVDPEDHSYMLDKPHAERMIVLRNLVKKCFKELPYDKESI